MPGRRYPAGVLHHLTLWVPDLDRAAPSWRWLLCETLDYALDDGPADARLLRFRQPGECTIVLEESADMVPGMLHSRLRPGLNHLAFTVASVDALAQTIEAARSHGWSPLPGDPHPIAGGAEVAYLEDRDGFEVELVAPAG